MVKLKVLSRLESDYTRETKHDVVRVERNPDPVLHPFEQAREYTRALNAAKLDKVFAKPFVGALSGHMDGVYSMAVNRTSLSSFVSGACDGEIKVWDIASQKNVWSAVAHLGFVRGLATTHSGSQFLSCGDDKTIKLWNFNPNMTENTTVLNSSLAGVRKPVVESSKIYSTDYSILGLDCHWNKDMFATSGNCLEIWDSNRTDALHRFEWGVDTVNSCAFNPSQNDVIAATANDRSISLYDIRMREALRKVVLPMNTNSISWNPREPFNFVSANEDHNCYSFDIRHFDKPLKLHRSHLGAVLSVSFSPTGKEFVTGSYDRTVRIFDSEALFSKEVYHTKRMQRIFCVKYSRDSRFVLSGSDDTNVRIWKAKANDKLRTVNSREKRKLRYDERLQKRYRHAPEIRKIRTHRHLPRNLYKQNNKKREMVHARQRKEDNRIKNSAGRILKVSAKNKTVVEEVE